MSRQVIGCLSWFFACAALAVFAGECHAQFAATPPGIDENSGIPESLKPFEHLAGAWKGMAIPAANRLKGWPERHLWAWKFNDGKPCGLVITFEGSPQLKQAVLLPGTVPGSYHLDLTTIAGESFVFSGTLDEKGRALTLDRDNPEAASARQRLALRLNANEIRYTWIQEEQEPGAPQYKRVLDANLGKEGESFAAGTGASQLPVCIMTGGAATMTVSYQGKSYPVCCSGCRDEFLANPEKYVAQAALKGQTGSPAPPASEPAASPTRPPAPTPEAAPTPAPEPEKNQTTADEARAQTLLRLGLSLEKSGKTTAAIDYYQRLQKEHAQTKAARAAAARLKALESP